MQLPISHTQVNKDMATMTAVVAFFLESNSKPCIPVHEIARLRGEYIVNHIVPKRCDYKANKFYCAINAVIWEEGVLFVAPEGWCTQGWITIASRPGPTPIQTVFTPVSSSTRLT